MRRLVALLLLAAWLGGCSGALRWTPDYHTVRSGETLFSIAERYGLNYRDLAAWNELGNGSFIREGQRLRLKPSASSGKAVRRAPAPAPAAPAPKWTWPTAGKVAHAFGASAKTESGIRIAGSEGQPVYAVAAGEVVYAGDGLPTYGQLIIIEHNPTWLTAYGFNSRLRVREGEKVDARQHIADLGRTRSGEAQLHFEIRRNGDPVDPLRYLPAR